MKVAVNEYLLVGKGRNENSALREYANDDDFDMMKSVR